MYYIYEYVDPRSMLPFYIGKGKGKRLECHLTETYGTTINIRKFRKIKKLTSIGLAPIINIIVNDIEDEELAYDLELKYILKYGRIGFEPNGILTNICLGSRPPHCIGEKNGMFNKKHTEESKAKMREALKGRIPWNKGIPRDDKVKEAVSKANKGKRAWNSGKTRSEEDRQKMKDGWAKRKAEGHSSHNKGKAPPKTHTCERCGELLSKSKYIQYHGSKCKKSLDCS